MSRAERKALEVLRDRQARFKVSGLMSVHLGRNTAQTLRQLVGAGLVAIEGNAQRFVYSITPEGKAALEGGGV
ncbi:hypothetical protein LH464_04155 [Neorhizobium sp. T786]|uniref:hypothetical protein n=1 Tax=Pseudorhizobium xiangyangii TaxID=2883104 RepID=UPI001CFF7797|nr:hypothetical protein [Neorhizobium xiangyangii]MCB5201670.1 hypothetical protein [Neorhizobium xiangyangii]